MPRRLASAATVLGLTAAGMTLTVGTAEAASYNSACGSGYSVIDSMDVGDGNTFLTYNSSTGYNCVVTVGDAPGTSQILGARLRLHSTSTTWKSSELDDGVFSYYAGPVYAYAKGSCIDWGGRAASNYTRVNYGVHCG
ncbi:spore-associated protein A [Streptomyces sp. NBC_01166]|uniref:spore-associated protein A n=1 Tax=Streptomyces sp. NBC_01166 TaxID=2903755 RepID=UPI003870ED7D|nr:spore-associated protein A [Streptomyces sp. NBC_01166]